MADVYQNVRIPGPDDKVYKDECVYSFDTPESENGLFICMSTFRGLAKDHVARHCKLNPGKNVFLHILRRRKPIPVDPNTEPVKVTKMAFGIEGGFDVNGSNKFTFEERYSIYIHPNVLIAYPDQADKLPEHAKQSADAIIAAESAFLKEERAAMNATWSGEERQVTKHAHTLEQLNNDRKIPPNGWKCDECDLKENLWLNLTDGAVLCGRKFYDGSGGNNHAVEHYYKTKYPLAVKLGTITPKGADVYSYDEDDMVEDPNLANHLAHWGINMINMEKTEQTMADLEIDLNKKYSEASIIEEANSKLQPLHGAGYTGIKNLGNSCYMNSVLQVLFTIKDFQEKYYKHCDFYFDNAKNPINDFNCQTAKLAFGLLSGLYSRELPSDSNLSFRPPTCIRPQMYRSLIGRDHPEFSTKQQQDAAEFLEYFLELIHKHCTNDPTPDASLDPSTCFQFELEERIYCPETSQVRYLTRNDAVFRVNVPLDAAKNMHEVLQYNKTKEDLEKQGKQTQDLPIVRPIIPITQSIARWAEPEIIDDFKIKRNGPPTTIRKTQRFITFPDYLIIQLKKYTFNDDWTPRKLDVSMEVPDDLDLNSLRATGFQHGETPMPDNDNELVADSITAKSSNQINQALLQQGNNTEATTNSTSEHQSNPNVDTPIQSSASNENENNISILISMGYSRAHALRALAMTNNNVEAAVDWAINNPEDNSTIYSLVDSLPQQSKSHQPIKPTHFRDGPGKYRLVAFISHIGNTTACGHYVSHILKDSRWVIFNDETVALSEHPPKDLAYLYVYKRTGH